MPPATQPLILAAACQVNELHTGSKLTVDQHLLTLKNAGLPVQRLEIDSLQVPWKGMPLRSGGSFQSGCAPVLALARARELITEGAAEAVLIRGEEPLRSGYQRAERRQLMRVFGDVSVPEAYTTLARLQMQQLGLDEAAYRRLADQLLHNYERTARRRGLPCESAHGERAATSLFRYSDCANPDVDFWGAVLLGTAHAAKVLGIHEQQPRLRGVAVELRGDGPAQVPDIVGYEHLRQAYERACAEAAVDYGQRFLAGEALLEAYTCFPPVPVGFLRATSIAPGVADLAPVLAGHEITVTGGMNLAKAPWNNPTLHALVVMFHRLGQPAPSPQLGLVHGNGGVGGYQGVAIIGVGEP